MRAPPWTEELQISGLLLCASCFQNNSVTPRSISMQSTHQCGLSQLAHHSTFHELASRCPPRRVVLGSQSDPMTADRVPIFQSTGALHCEAAWRNAWWIRVDHGPHIEPGKQPGKRPNRSTTEIASGGKRERETEKREKGGKQGRTERATKPPSTLSDTSLQPSSHSHSNSRSSNRRRNSSSVICIQGLAVCCTMSASLPFRRSLRR